MSDGVRGTTRWQHAQVMKKVINLDRGGTFVVCAWDTCDRDGHENHKIVQHEHVSAIPCDHELARHCTYVFCSDRHRQYWWYCTGANARDSEERNRGQVMGMLPPGYKNYMS